MIHLLPNYFVKNVIKILRIIFMFMCYVQKDHLRKFNINGCSIGNQLNSQ